MINSGETKAAKLPDTSARVRIREDLEANLIVEAGAGSGKTTELIGRMVALVSTGFALVHEIAAVTPFTRKAAAELGERFQRRLEGLIRDQGPDSIEGVVDLAFREEGGWVIADYKTDRGTDPNSSSRLKAYRQQVDLYADAWTRLTGDPVKERILFFTAQDRLESW
jgi:ATP-dependent exoDNAse (exonuclease V) beta subunit